MNELTIKIEAPGLIAALERLAEAVRGDGQVDKPSVPVSVPTVPAAPVSTSVPAVPTMPGSAPSPAPAVPTTPAPGYTLEQLSRVGAELIAADPTNLAGLQGLLQQFGVQAITMLPAEQYGAFATALRRLGAKI